MWMMKRTASEVCSICNLSFDVYVKKQLIEKWWDELPKPDKKKGASFLRRIKKGTDFRFEIRSFLLLSVWQ